MVNKSTIVLIAVSLLCLHLFMELQRYEPCVCKTDPTPCPPVAPAAPISVAPSPKVVDPVPCPPAPECPKVEQPAPCPKVPEQTPCPPPPPAPQPEVQAPPAPCVADGSSEFQPIDFYDYPGRTFLQVAASLKSIPQTDKVTFHAYEVIYEKYLGPLRHKKNIKILEVGIGCRMFNGPGRGYELYTAYMPHVKYHAIDNGKCIDLLRQMGNMTLEEARRRQLAHISKEGIDYLLDHMVWGSQSDRVTTDEAIKRWGPFDVIIDDASHLPALTLATFRNMFIDGLKPGGAYIIEDLAVSFKQNWGGTREAQILHETVPGYINELLVYHHFEYWNTDPRNKLHMLNIREHLNYTEWIRTIECDREICAITKRHERVKGADTLRKNVLPKF